MAGMRPDGARRFYEEDEDPARIHGLFDAAGRDGRRGLAEPPPRGRNRRHCVSWLVSLAAN